MNYDYHVHSCYSDDSTMILEDVIKQAVDIHLDEICITDHVDYGIKKDFDEGNIEYRDNGDPLANVNYPEYFKEIDELKEKYKDKIIIKKGLEFGMQMHTIHKYQKLFDTYPMDFVILSVHQVEDLEFWTQDFQRGRTQKEYNERYYQEILDLVTHYKDYSVLGHLDLIVRYDNNGVYPFEKIKPLLTKILKQVIKDGKGIEINTSYHRYKLNDTTPARDILKLYKELGGTIITIGSDSHKKDHLGAYIKEAKEELKDIGFKHFCTFENMKPIYHDL